MDNKNNSKPKLKSAKNYVSKGNSKEAKEKTDDVSSSVSSPPLTPEDPPIEDTHEEEYTEDSDVVVPDCQPDSNLPIQTSVTPLMEMFQKTEISKIGLRDFLIIMETVLTSFLDGREEVKRKAEIERLQKKIDDGEEVLTLQQAFERCYSYMKAIKDSYNLYAEHKSSVNKQMQKITDIVKDQLEVSKRFQNMIGRIEKVQGVKVPKRPPFPSWACLTYLLWHWPMYAFSYCWLSKYFRRFCFLVAFFVMIIEFCLIVLLAGDNRAYHNERMKYNIVRNWSYVLEDSAAMNRFNKVDLLFEDVEFNREKIMDIGNMIQTKNEELQKKRRKW